ncbi:MAG: ABC transporter permease [Acidobacteria bacterium]|nr:ABC transporter permease [Acidobacteriota bacterium]
MPYEIFLALRYLRVRRGRRVVKLTALAAVAGIACGVAALIVALALANGFRDELRDKILRGTAHVTLMPDDSQAVADSRFVAARVRGVEGVVEAAPTTYEGALLKGPGGMAYTLLRGVDEQSARTRGEIRRTLTAGELETLFRQTAPGEPDKGSQRASGAPGAAEQRAPGVEDESGTEDEEEDEPPAPVILGENLAARTGLREVGHEGWVVTGEKSPTPPGFSPRARRVVVVGVFRTGLYDYDSTWTYLPLAEVPRIAGAELKSSVVSIEVRDIFEAEAVAGRVRAALGEGWTTVDWREANRPLFAALELERRTVALIILLIMVMAALNITTTLALVVVERRPDIAVLGAMGARPRGILTIFIIEGAVIGAVGALAGVALGLAACAAGEYFEVVRLPPDVYSISAVPFRPHLAEVLLPALAAFAVSLLATLYPARAAARVRPAEALRYE